MLEVLLKLRFSPFNGRIMLKVSLEYAFLHLAVRKDVKWTFP